MLWVNFSRRPDINFGADLLRTRCLPTFGGADVNVLRTLDQMSEA
jgi:hypothetical protein